MNKNILAMAGGAILLMGSAVGATLYFTGALNGKAHATAPAKAEEGKADEAKPADGHNAGAIFFSLDPSFVVNVDDADGLTHFLQVQVDVRLHDAATMERIKSYMPRIRNDLVMLLSAQDREAVRTEAGRVQLQAQVKDAMNKVLQEETGSAGVDAVYFTKLVLQ